MIVANRKVNDFFRNLFFCSLQVEKFSWKKQCDSTGCAGILND